MSRLFMIGVDGMSKEAEAGIIEHFDNEGISWWHWMDNVWVIRTETSSTSGSVRDLFRDKSSNRNVIVVEIRSGTWSSYGPSTKKRRFAEWFTQNWNK